MKSVEIRSFFWSIPSRIWTEYGKILRISPYSVQMRENTDQKKLRNWTLLAQCHPPNCFFYLLQWLPFKNDEKCFLFHLKSLFRSQEI